jgi:hypothetical protein
MSTGFSSFMINGKKGQLKRNKLFDDFGKFMFKLSSEELLKNIPVNDNNFCKEPS